MTPRVLLICYYFPPLGGAGVGRPLSLFRLLPSHGIQCDVLTVKPVAYRVFEPELLEGLDPSRIYRSGSYDPQRLLYLAGIRHINDARIRSAGWLSERFFPDNNRGWVRSAVRKAGTVLRANDYAAIISTSPPISCHLVAEVLTAETGLPWIADFRDFWLSHKIENVFADRARRERAWQLIGGFKERAAAITTCNPAIAHYLGAGRTIYNGYDNDLAQVWQPPPVRTTATIGLLGTFDDMVPVKPLFELLALLRKQSPELFKRIKLLQVGRLDVDWFQAQLHKYQLSDLCHAHGFQNRRRSIEILSEASLMYISLASEKEHGIVPSRLFDLFASGRPIIAAVPPDSQVADLIGETQNGCCFDPAVSSELARAVDFVGHLIQEHLSGGQTITTCPAYAQPFAATAMVDQFAELIKAL
jgi:glycosyltransferase involved in cell wall biosynthesis